MAATIEQVEDAIISALEPLKASLGVRTIKTYGGELETEDEVKAITLFPAVYVVYGGSEYEEHGSRKVERMTFHILACDRSLRSEAEARRGGTGNPGVYAMLEAVRNVLYGETLGLGSETFPFRLIRQAAIWFSATTCIYGAEYETAQQHLYPF